MTDLNPTKPAHYPALDGLRGVAILLVVFLHNFGFTNYFFFGWLGVDLFFVLSGFLITDILMNSVGKPNYLRNFYMRRVLRIFPLFYFILIIVLIILPQIKTFSFDLRYYLTHQGWLWTYLQNWLFIFKHPHGTPLLQHTWSLAVEEQFYLIWPVVILWVRKPARLLAIVIATLVFVIIMRYIVWEYYTESLAYDSLYTFTRIDGLCIGAMLALVLRVNPGFLRKYNTLIVLLMAVINFAFYFINGQHSFTLPYLAFAGYTSFAVLFGLLVFEAVSGELKWVQFVFDNRILKFFGRISYGLYVYHWPLYIILFSFVRNEIVSRELVSFRVAELISATLITIGSVIISVLSYRFLEKPFLRLKDRFA